MAGNSSWLTRRQEGARMYRVRSHSPGILLASGIPEIREQVNRDRKERQLTTNLQGVKEKIG